MRSEFRKWAAGYSTRHLGRHVPGAVHVKAGSRSSPIAHWQTVSYLLKTYDPRAELVGARNTADGMPLRLSDIMSHAAEDPGEFALRRRLFVSNNLGRARRRIGFPPFMRGNFRRQPSPLAMSVSAPSVTPTDDVPTLPVLPGTYRAAVDDGVYDVRLIYGEEYAKFMHRHE